MLEKIIDQNLKTRQDLFAFIEKYPNAAFTKPVTLNFLETSVIGLKEIHPGGEAENLVVIKTDNRETWLLSLPTDDLITLAEQINEQIIQPSITGQLEALLERERTIRFSISDALEENQQKAKSAMDLWLDKLDKSEEYDVDDTDGDIEINGWDVHHLSYIDDMWMYQNRYETQAIPAVALTIDEMLSVIKQTII